MPLRKNRTAKRGLIKLLAAEYFNAVDREHATCCVFNSTIVARSLKLFGLDVKILPAQMIYRSLDKELVVGFTGDIRPGQWDGHLAVRVGDVLIDCSTSIYHKYFGLKVPSIVLADCIRTPSKLLAAVEIDDASSILWLEPPAPMPPLPPQPESVVNSYAKTLVERVCERMARVREGCSEPLPFPPSRNGRITACLYLP